MTNTQNDSFGSSTESYSYTATFKFEKDGTYESIITQAGNTATSKGNWNFMGGIGDAKNKERIVLMETSYVGDSNSSTTTNPAYGDILYIKELRNKKMVICSNESYSSDDFSNSNSYEITFEQ